MDALWLSQHEAGVILGVALVFLLINAMYWGL